MPGLLRVPLYLAKSQVLIISLVVHLQNQRDVFSYDADDDTYNSPSPDSKIPSPSQPSPPNTSQEGDIF